MQRPSPRTLAEIVNLANDLRASFGQGTIEDLPKGVPGDSHQCILARAFNFDCEIGPMRDGPGAAYFRDTRHAASFAELTGGSVLDGTGKAVALTPELNAVALAFDDGELNEYVENYDPEEDA